MFQGSVKGTGYPLHSPVTPSLPLQCVTVCHHVSTGLYTLPSSCLCSYFLHIFFFVPLSIILSLAFSHFLALVPFSLSTVLSLEHCDAARVSTMFFLERRNTFSDGNMFLYAVKTECDELLKRYDGEHDYLKYGKCLDDFHTCRQATHQAAYNRNPRTR